MSKMKVFNTEPPEYGKDYGRGWIGFNHAGSWFSSAIAHVQRWDKKEDIDISHVLIVSGEDECIEAAYPKGVVRTGLTEGYWDKTDRYVVFRQPKDLTEDIADQLIETAERELGNKFDYSSVANMAVQKNFVGWMINKMFFNKPAELADKLNTDDDEWVCSSLAAYCMAQIDQYEDAELLQRPPGVISPQELFEADGLFEPFPDDDEVDE
ncbi:hypothetical protein [Stratiformator vulcanicus]|uniref:Uncharacterized protein n=1 Tax=Stratiformator vulcanicus TaxID=2527980 RepID=A0A517R3W4_9PLAN|nr:hypothetical protein [Stratiformator vulcanicus]QDT38556.1 hypothetical protein Pan189_29510 [Stratiformator vulcanicus]